MQEYKQLYGVKVGLDAELAVFRRLLETEEDRLGWNDSRDKKQVVPEKDGDLVNGFTNQKGDGKNNENIIGPNPGAVTKNKPAHQPPTVQSQSTK